MWVVFVQDNGGVVLEKIVGHKRENFQVVEVRILIDVESVVRCSLSLRSVTMLSMSLSCKWSI